MWCSCGTTIDAAVKLGRQWIGIDITQLATTLIKGRLRDTYRTQLEIKTVGEPVTYQDALALASKEGDNDKYQFQWWALGLVGARPVEQKSRAEQDSLRQQPEGLREPQKPFLEPGKSFLGTHKSFSDIHKSFMELHFSFMELKMLPRTRKSPSDRLVALLVGYSSGIRS